MLRMQITYPDVPNHPYRTTWPEKHEAQARRVAEVLKRDYPGTEVTFTKDESLMPVVPELCR